MGKNKIIKAWSKKFTDIALIKRMLKSRFTRKILSAIGPDYVVVQSEGAKYNCSLVDHMGVNHFLLKNGHYEPFIAKTILAELPQRGAFLDIGANIGYFTILAASKRDIDVFAVEPDPSICAEIQANVQLNNLNNVLVHNFALSDEQGELTFYKSAKNKGDNRCYQFDEDVGESIKVNSYVGDDIFEPQILKKIRLIKIDVQGFEYKVLKGFKNYLKSAENLTIISELELQMLKDAGSDPKEYLNFVSDCGFEVFLLNEMLETVEKKSIEDILAWAEKYKTTNIMLKK